MTLPLPPKDVCGARLFIEAWEPEADVEKGRGPSCDGFDAAVQQLFLCARRSLLSQ